MKDVIVEVQLEFRTDRFKLSGPLPDHINAGNQFYGEDVSLWLCETLPQWNLTCMDEDWGWLVCTRKDHSSDVQRNMICVYAYPANDQGTSDCGNWMLSIVTEYKTKWLGFLTRWKRGPFDPALARDVIGALEKLGVRDLKRTEQ